MTRLRIVPQNAPEPGSEARGRIISAAVRPFSRRGYHNTIADLANAIGQTSGAIFHHLNGKEDLLRAVVDWLARGRKAYSEVAKGTANDSHQLLEETGRVMRGHYHGNSEATICLAALAAEFAGSNQPMEERLKEVYEVFIEAFAHSRATTRRCATRARRPSSSWDRSKTWPFRDCSGKMSTASTAFPKPFLPCSANGEIKNRGGCGRQGPTLGRQLLCIKTFGPQDGMMIVTTTQHQGGRQCRFLSIP